MSKKLQNVAQYLPTIGIECHVQLNTRSKLFASESNDARQAAPNTTVGPISFGYPGVLPVLNKRAVLLAVRAGLALNAQINKVSLFDRKHYFYPDLHKGYQISQYHQPIVGAGYVEIPSSEGGYQRVGITRAHLEEDAGKLVHPTGADYSLVDLNRAGTPLIEIVSDPDMHSADQAKAFVTELYLLMKYAAVSDVDLYHGNMRFDVNISIAKVGSSRLGIRSEIKNLNSFRSVYRCVEYEITRQIELNEAGQANTQQTRGWDEVHQKTVTLRGKEESHDYRYFPDPDLPPVVVSEAEIKQQSKLIPLLPKERREQFAVLGLDASQVQGLINNVVLGNLLLGVLPKLTTAQAKRVANWLTLDLIGREVAPEQTQTAPIKLTADQLQQLAVLVDSGQINNSQAKVILRALQTQPIAIEQVIAQEGWGLVQESSDLEALVEKVIEENPQAVSDARNQKPAALHYLVGKVMQASSSRANPEQAEKIFRRILFEASADKGN